MNVFTRAAPALPPNYLRACLQLLLAEGTAHGYQLAERVGELGLEAADRGSVYRVLRTLERDGLVESSWEEGSGTPPRRTYQITALGVSDLAESAEALREGRDLLAGFLARLETTGGSGRGEAA